MRMGVLSGVQVGGPCEDGSMYVYFVGQVVDAGEHPYETGDIYPVVISKSGTKDVPRAGELVDIDSMNPCFGGTSLIYRR